ncbi:MAG: peptide-methionine (S)-S-oxide reductase, partial [Chthonomonadales bacterium]
YQTPEEEAIAKATIKELTDQKIFPNPIVTEVSAFTNFFSAEDYHKDFYAKHGFQPYCQAVIAPKLAKFRQYYRDKLKK